MKKATRKTSKKKTAGSVRPGRNPRDAADADTDLRFVADELYRRLISEAERDGDTQDARRLQDEMASFTDRPPSAEWLKFRESWSCRIAVGYRRALSWDPKIPKKIELPATLRAYAGMLQNGFPFDGLERETKADLVNEAGEWLLDCIAKSEAQRIIKLGKLIREREKQFEKWHNDEISWYPVAGFYDEGWLLFGLADQEGNKHSEILLRFHELWTQKSIRTGFLNPDSESKSASWHRLDRDALVNKEELAKACGIDWEVAKAERTNEHRSFDRRLKDLGLDGLPAS